MTPFAGKLTKKYYKIGDVAEILGIPASTLRFWEKRFTIIKPHRTENGTRLYTPSDIEKISMIYFLVKERGLHLDAAQEAVRKNPNEIDKNFQVVTRLKNIRHELKTLLNTLRRMR